MYCCEKAMGRRIRIRRRGGRREGGERRRRSRRRVRRIVIRQKFQELVLRMGAEGN
jgi:hypothetical protein